MRGKKHWENFRESQQASVPSVNSKTMLRDPMVCRTNGDVTKMAGDFRPDTRPSQENCTCYGGCPATWASFMCAVSWNTDRLSGAKAIHRTGGVLPLWSQSFKKQCCHLNSLCHKCKMKRTHRSLPAVGGSDYLQHVEEHEVHHLWQLTPPVDARPYLGQ